ncbi:S-adenosylmethionine decarboxylase proenzyme 4 [Prunus yedoensis var. nudiflora]|uniref:S-adenosylmethionine decarboxylase proenzyme 4 n=1 Tax=Prunus yedoensis var. nudiflora TaxID=2094558 RepID=A0A314UA95_PRUYE|nr:S-adenosylmethionine decarboxylase proenzyme 4 [Prunus yedoensis var. nudiflora]
MAVLVLKGLRSAWSYTSLGMTLKMGTLGLGLRLLDFDSIQEVLDEVQCTVVSAVANHYFDAYVLSESSLFVYPTKIIIKTCGTTQLLKSIPPLLRHASLDLGLTLSSCRYTRGNFIFPRAQPFPYTNFQNEVVYLEESLPAALCYRKASVMPSKTPRTPGTCSPRPPRTRRVVSETATTTICTPSKSA